jgi:UDP-N-acetylmuramoyl-tripeptide--D-alanyl-D-alanine ligase
MKFWDIENLRDITGGKWLIRPTAAVEAAGVSTDSRAVKPGQVFVALRGEKFDGHDFLQTAADAGAALLLVDREEAAKNLTGNRPAVLLVDDTLAALTQLAVAYRKTFTGRVIAVTGSVGKTTTKHIIHAVLATRLKGKASPKSFNNHIGVPLTLLSVEPTDQYVVVEIGTNHPGEIAALAKITQPDIAIVTYVGCSHIEHFGTIDAILREKASLLSYLTPGGLAIVNGDIEGLADYRRVVPAMITYGRGEQRDLRLTGYKPAADDVAWFEVNGRNGYRLPLIGEHNALNALAAIAVARHLGFTDQQIADGLARATPPDMRMNVKTVGPADAPLTLIIDCYNANPESMRAAIGVLGSYKAKGRRVAVLGDMFELGDAGPDLHRSMAEALIAAKIDAAILIGKLTLFTDEALSRSWPSDRVHALGAFTDATPAQVANLLQPTDTVLIKASRGMGLERLLPVIKERLTQRCG